MAPVTTDAKPKTADGGKAVAGPLSAEELRKMHAYFRALNYLTVGQIYLLDNPLLKEPLKREHIKPRLLGHWGTSPGLNMLCVHLNRVIKRDDLNMIYIIGPGHGGPSMVAHGARAAYFYQAVEEKLIEHKHYIREHGDDMPEIAGWRWSSRDGAAAARCARTSTEGDNV